MGGGLERAWVAVVSGVVGAVVAQSVFERRADFDASQLQQEVASLQRRLEAMEQGARPEPALQPSPAAPAACIGPPPSAPAPLPPRADDERARWREAERLGIAAEIARSHTRLGPNDEYRLAVAIVREARRHGLDPRLVAAVIRVESSFDALAKSPRGALGLMQVMPRTGEWLAERSREPLASPDALLEYDRNVALGARYLAELVRQFGGSVEQALLAYNAGPAAARRILADAGAAGGALAGYPRKVLDEYERLTGAAVETASREPARGERSPVSGRRPGAPERATP